MSKTNRKPILMEYTGELIRSQLENRIPYDIPEGITIEELEKIAHEGHMDYMLLGALLKLPQSEDIVQRLRPYLIRSTMKTLAQVCSVKELQKSFEAAGIKNQVLKGAVLKTIYPRPEMREMSDIDVMVYESDFAPAEKILLEQGYVKYQAIKHHVIFKKSPFLVFEMHWSLYEQTVDKGQFLYYKDHFRAMLKEGCRYTYEFSVEDFYVYLISHMAKHFYEQGCGIRNLVDIYVYLEQYGEVMNQEKVSKELGECGLTAFEHHAAKLARIWLANEESTDFYNQMFLYMLDCGIYGKSENGIWGQLAKQDIKNRMSSKKQYYFPSLQYMKEYYPWLDGKSALLPLAWICRAVHGITSKGAKDRAKLLEDKEKSAVMTKMYHELKLNFVK